jgi:hypothetical protein
MAGMLPTFDALARSKGVDTRLDLPNEYTMANRRMIQYPI